MLRQILTLSDLFYSFHCIQFFSFVPFVSTLRSCCDKSTSRAFILTDSLVKYRDLLSLCQSKSIKLGHFPSWSGRTLLNFEGALYLITKMQFSLDRPHFSPFCPHLKKKKKTKERKREKKAMLLFPMLVSFWGLYIETTLRQYGERTTLGLSSSTDGWCVGNLLWAWGEASDTKCDVSSQKNGCKSWRCCNEKQVMTQKETKALFLLEPFEISDLAFMQTSKIWSPCEPCWVILTITFTF